jgi:hypothetical protein
MATALVGRIAYRVRQFGHALLAGLIPLSPAAEVEIRSLLPPDAWRLFSAMASGDRWHSWHVLRALRSRGWTDLPLLQAALLHDCAKQSGGVRLWHRVAAVMLRVLRPGWLARQGAARAMSRSDWRYPFWLHYNHPQCGAALAAAAGCDPRAVLLIDHHQDPVPASMGDPAVDRWLAALQAADDDN